ncbi:MAG: 4Fe-4S dicluster domain-containing protein, partial [Anaerolineaceae bacterium]|nr:4Fe-4S dicluster domain-containing protein [Anaerolineaceae bacterium]
GMSSLEQMKDNISFMKDFRPLSDAEQQAVVKVKEIFRKMNLIPCTSCHYCIEENHCPKDIMIPDMFACLNAKKMFNDWNQCVFYRNIVAEGHGKASDCLKCGKCEKVCPQHLEIRDLLTQVAKTFE